MYPLSSLYTCLQLSVFSESWSSLLSTEISYKIDRTHWGYSIYTAIKSDLILKFVQQLTLLSWLGGGKKTTNHQNWDFYKL